MSGVSAYNLKFVAESVDCRKRKAYRSAYSKQRLWLQPSVFKHWHGIDEREREREAKTERGEKMLSRGMLAKDGLGFPCVLEPMPNSKVGNQSNQGLFGSRLQCSNLRDFPASAVFQERRDIIRFGRG